MKAVAKCSNLVLPKGFVELDREEMTYVDGGVYLSAGFCNTIALFALGGTLTSLGIIAAGSMAGVNILSAVYCLGAKVAGAIGSFCVTNPWAAPVIAFVVVWARLNWDAFTELGCNIFKAAANGRGVDVWVSWFKLNSAVR